MTFLTNKKVNSTFLVVKRNSVVNFLYLDSTGDLKLKEEELKKDKK